MQKSYKQKPFCLFWRCFYSTHLLAPLWKSLSQSLVTRQVWLSWLAWYFLTFLKISSKTIICWSSPRRYSLTDAYLWLSLHQATTWKGGSSSRIFLTLLNLVYLAPSLLSSSMHLSHMQVSSCLILSFKKMEMVAYLTLSSPTTLQKLLGKRVMLHGCLLSSWTSYLSPLWCAPVTSSLLWLSSSLKTNQSCSVSFLERVFSMTPSQSFCLKSWENILNRILMVQKSNLMLVEISLKFSSNSSIYLSNR